MFHQTCTMDAFEALDSASPMNAKNLVNFLQRSTAVSHKLNKGNSRATGVVGTSAVDDAATSGGKDVGSTGTNSSKKRGTLNSSVNLFTFVKILHTTAKECRRDNTEIAPENLLKFVKNYRLNVNQAKDGASTTTSNNVLPSTTVNAAKNVSSDEDDDDDDYNNVDNNWRYDSDNDASENDDTNDDNHHQNTKDIENNVDETAFDDEFGGSEKVSDDDDDKDSSSNGNVPEIPFVCEKRSKSDATIDGNIANAVNEKNKWEKIKHAKKKQLEKIQAQNNSKNSGNENKRKRKIETAIDKNNDTDGKYGNEANSCHKKQRQDLGKYYLKVYNCLFVAFERENINVSFLREHLRFFLATYKNFVTLEDFKCTNKQQQETNNTSAINSNSNKPIVPKNKAKNILHNGNILVEYFKSPASFQNNLCRCNNTDADALRYVTNFGIELPQNIYKPMMLMFNEQIVNNKTNDTHEGYVKLSFNGTKHYVICCTENIFLIWDGMQYTLPTTVMEKDITATMLYKICRPTELYAVQVLICGNKPKIADVVYSESPFEERTFVKGQTYAERQRRFKQIFKNWDLVKIEPDDYNDSNAQVPNIYDPSKVKNRYIFVKPGQIVAAVGMDKQNVLLAYRRLNGDVDYEYKLKIMNAGPASGTLMCQPKRRTSIKSDEINGDFITIRDTNNRTVRVHKFPVSDDSYIFKRIVPVELRDGLKLGSYMIGPINDLSEYKQINIQKNGNKHKVFDRFFNDPKFFQDFVMYCNNNVTDATKERFYNTLKVSDRINDVELNYN